MTASGPSDCRPLGEVFVKCVGEKFSVQRGVDQQGRVLEEICRSVATKGQPCGY